MFEVLPKRGFDYSPDLLGWDLWNPLLFAHWKSFRECALCILLSTRDSDSSSFRYLTPAQERLCPKMVKIPFARFLCRIFPEKSWSILISCFTTVFQFSLRNFDLMPWVVQVISLPGAWHIFPNLSKNTFSCQVITKKDPHKSDTQTPNINNMINHKSWLQIRFANVIGFLRCYICWYLSSQLDLVKNFPLLNFLWWIHSLKLGVSQ